MKCMNFYKYDSIALVGRKRHMALPQELRGQELSYTKSESEVDYKKLILPF